MYLLRRVSTSFFSSVSIFDPVDCYVSPPSIISITNRVDCCIYPPNLPSHLAQKHIISNDHCPRLCFRQCCFVDPSIISTAAASTEAKGMCFGSNFTTNSRGREVESEELTINYIFICSKFM